MGAEPDASFEAAHDHEHPFKAETDTARVPAATGAPFHPQPVRGAAAVASAAPASAHAAADVQQQLQQKPVPVTTRPAVRTGGCFGFGFSDESDSGPSGLVPFEDADYEDENARMGAAADADAEAEAEADAERWDWDGQSLMYRSERPSAASDVGTVITEAGLVDLSRGSIVLGEQLRFGNLGHGYGHSGSGSRGSRFVRRTLLHDATPLDSMAGDTVAEGDEDTEDDDAAAAAEQPPEWSAAKRSSRTSLAAMFGLRRDVRNLLSSEPPMMARPEVGALAAAAPMPHDSNEAGGAGPASPAAHTASAAALPALPSPPVRTVNSQSVHSRGFALPKPPSLKGSALTAALRSLGPAPRPAPSVPVADDAAGGFAGSSTSISTSTGTVGSVQRGAPVSAAATSAAAASPSVLGAPAVAAAAAAQTEVHSSMSRSGQLEAASGSRAPHWRSLAPPPLPALPALHAMAAPPANAAAVASAPPTAAAFGSGLAGLAPALAPAPAPAAALLANPVRTPLLPPPVPPAPAQPPAVPLRRVASLEGAPTAAPGSNTVVAAAGMPQPPAIIAALAAPLPRPLHPPPAPPARR